jgi:hypothetical protein
MRLHTAGWRFVVAFALCLWTTADVSAVQVTLNLVQSQSFLTLNGQFGETPIVPQDESVISTPGTIDLDPSHPSNRTSLTGSITVDVDNVLAPSTIQILSANMDATVTGHWVPEPQPVEGAVVNPGDPFPNTGLPADIGFKVEAEIAPPDCCNAHAAALRDVTYNLVSAEFPSLTPVVEPVNPQGEFSSLNQVLTYRSGWLDFWLGFPLNERGRDDVTGDDAPNQHTVDQTTQPDDTITPIPNAPSSTYVASGGIATLTIPVEINVIDDFSQFVTGQLVATFEIPSGSDGDYNEDGTVNAADYVAWRKLPIAFGGDPDGYNAWREQFGEAGSGAGGGGGVPEPASVGLLVIGLVPLFVRRHRSSR